MGGYSGCLTRILLLPLTIGAVYPLLGLPLPLSGIVFPLKGPDATAIVVGISLWFALLSFLDIRRYTSDLALINQGFLRDDEKIIVSGPIEPQAPLLKAPFSGKKCVAYHYNAQRPSRPGHMDFTCYEGYALIPALIKHPLGNIKILAEPNLELFYEVPMADSVCEAEQAKKYLLSCSFGEDVKGLGNFRVDKKIGEPKDLERSKFKEGIIQSGDIVLLSGVYSSEQGGLKDPDNIMTPFHIVPDGENILRKKIRNRGIGIAICLGLSAAAIAVYFLWFGQPDIR